MCKRIDDRLNTIGNATNNFNNNNMDMLPQLPMDCIENIENLEVILASEEAQLQLVCINSLMFFKY